LKTKNKIPYLIQLFNWLEIPGAFTDLYKSGFLSKRAKSCLDAWKIVDAEMRRGIKKTAAVAHAPDLLGVSTQTIFISLHIIENYKPGEDLGELFKVFEKVENIN